MFQDYCVLERRVVIYIDYSSSVKIATLTYLATDTILLDFATDTGSNHTGILDNAATEKRKEEERTTMYKKR